MATRQQNHWNWAASVEVRAPGSEEVIAEYDIQQVWDGSRKGHQRLWAACTENLEGLRDRTGLRYMLWQPTAIRGQSWSSDEPEYLVVS